MIFFNQEVIAIKWATLITINITELVRRRKYSWFWKCQHLLKSISVPHTYRSSDLQGALASNLLSVKVLSSDKRDVFNKVIQFTVSIIKPDQTRHSGDYVKHECRYLQRELRAAGFPPSYVYEWRSDGCTVLSMDESSITCRCEHTTTYGVLIYSKDYQSQVEILIP